MRFFHIFLCIIPILIIGCGIYSKPKITEGIIGEITSAEEISEKQFKVLSTFNSQYTLKEEKGIQVRYADGKLDCYLIKADLREILLKIADLANIQIVFAENVYGRVNAKFSGFLLEDALRLILDSVGYEFEKIDDIYTIKRHPFASDRVQYHEVRLNNILAENLMERISAFYGIPFQAELSSSSGSVTSESMPEISPYIGPTSLKMEGITIVKLIDKNILLVSGERDKVEELLDLIEILDQKVPQILIETYLVEYDENALRESGIDLSAEIIKDALTIAINGGFERASMLRMPTILEGTKIWKKSFEITAPELIDQEIEAQAPSSEDVTRYTTLVSRIQALIDKNSLKVISKPYVVVNNNMQAVISSASEQYVVATVIGEQGKLMEKAETKTSFRIIPTIISDNAIHVQLSLEQSEFTTPQPNAALGTNKNTAQTSLIVSDGETIVIGGINTSREVVATRGIPFLKDIPVLKYIFGVSSRINISKKVNFYVTPHILPLKEGIIKEEIR